MENLEQIRARNALAKAEDAKAKKRQGEGDALSGYPSLIITNGLLATLAFSIEKEKQPQRIANAIAYHLANMPENENLVAPLPATAEGLRTKLTQSDSSHLKQCTAEALAFLSYLKRFAK